MRYLDAITATITAIAGLSATFFSYIEIVKIEKPTSTYLEDHLRIGQHSYDIISNDKCIGSTTVRLDHNKATFLKSKGELRAEVNKIPIDVEISIDSYFNPLGQLSESIVKVEGNNILFTLATREINPILIQFATAKTGKDYNFNTKVSGPVSIYEFEPGKMRIEYEGAAKLNSKQLTSPLDFIKNSYKLDVVPQSEESICTTGSKDRIDLSGILQLAQNFSLKKGANLPNLQLEEQK